LGDWACGMDELGGYATGDESRGIVYVGGEDGSVLLCVWKSVEM
jgi:hypothetical protein